jgi:hypothetical protein
VVGAAPAGRVVAEAYPGVDESSSSVIDRIVEEKVQRIVYEAAL